MTASIPDKPYFRIGEVSKILGLAPYVIRFWESEFTTVKPARTSSSQRLYRRKDVEELLKIKELLYKEKFTISGAKKRLTEVKTRGISCDSDQNLLVVVKKGLIELRNLLH